MLHASQAGDQAPTQFDGTLRANLDAAKAPNACTQVDGRRPSIRDGHFDVTPVARRARQAIVIHHDPDNIIVDCHVVAMTLKRRKSK